ncbi:MAG: efflux RND transporter permease subunit [Candidatus Delongbacteria bacterium]|jgi:Cu(I)/Ag(I) efflux system membrane protein CusA/SilA|nr:efflux RND transporter permease subunit [Candidatus Delongbacteria bacterium]
MFNNIILFFLKNKIITFSLLIFIVIAGLFTSPFNSDGFFSDEYSVAVDAIPDIGENQQIVFTKWAGKSPQDIDDQITYPLTTSLLGIPGIKTIRSSSMFGFSSIYVIFEDKIDFYWSRSRILEKINSLPAGTLPESVTPTLGPDATGLGQIFWYTIEAFAEDGTKSNEWSMEELRSVQDYYVKYSLASSYGVSEVASIGGHVKEFQIDVNPAAMNHFNVTLNDIMNSVRNSNLDVGARTLEINKVEYFIRGVGFLENLEDINKILVKNIDNRPIYLSDVAQASIGPADRRNALDKNGAEVVGGVVVARFGENPLKVIKELKKKILEIEPGLPEKQLEDGSIVKLKIIPFYDRTTLIKETLGTLNKALLMEILVTIIVIIIMVMNIRASAIISVLMPIAVLMTFVAMKYFNVDANIVALSGIAIAIGTIADVGIVLTENIIRHLHEFRRKNIEYPVYSESLNVVFNAVKEVIPSVATAISTTVISFIPVFAMTASEGKLFKPLAFTKSFVLISSLLVAVFILPALAHILFSFNIDRRKVNYSLSTLLFIIGIFYAVFFNPLFGILIAVVAIMNFSISYFHKIKVHIKLSLSIFIALSVAYFLNLEWTPIGADYSTLANFIFTIVVISLFLSIIVLFNKFYNRILIYVLDHKMLFLSIPAFFTLIGFIIWVGFGTVMQPVANTFDKLNFNIRTNAVYSSLLHKFPGIGKEFMPSLDEGSFLLMPTSMPHAGIEENLRVLKNLDIAVNNIPEVENVVGKLGRAETALDPAPISMYENIINYKTEYIVDVDGNNIRFKTDSNNEFVRDENDNLIKDSSGRYFRQWRDKIKTSDDIWKEIVNATKFTGVTSAPKLQPIETRLIMLQTGMRAPMGIKVSGSSLQDIEKFGLDLEKTLKEIPDIKKESVFAERIVGKPYLEINIDRNKAAFYGLSIMSIQSHVATLIGGKSLTTMYDGREKYNIRVRYPSEFRNSIQKINDIKIGIKGNQNITLSEIAEITYTQGPQVIKSENTFLIGYVIFDKIEGRSEVDVIDIASELIKDKIDNGSLIVPAGVSYTFTGNYENQVRAEKRLSLLIPIVLMVILLILYLQFKKIIPVIIIYTAILVSFAGGFIMIWFYGQDWFMNFNIFELNLREIFSIETIYLSVAVWVGFIALFGIATDDGVLMMSYLEQTFKKDNPKTKDEIRRSVVKAGMRRIRPCLMTTATTILALLPILTSTGRGADIMKPMAIPIFGGMTIELITLLVVPVLYSIYKESGCKKCEVKND